jgi:hypothetical protein
MADGYLGHGAVCFATAEEAGRSLAVGTQPSMFIEPDQQGTPCTYLYSVEYVADGDYAGLNWSRAGIGQSCAFEETSYVAAVPISACEYIADPFRLDLTQGSQIAVAILGVWIVAWAWKALARTLQGGVEEKEIS